MHRKGVLLVALAALLLAFVATPCFSQTAGRIAGIVSDKETGEPLAGANVIVVGTSYGAATDMRGEFFILNVPVGTYAVKATYMGYADVTQENIIINIGLTTRLAYEMSSKAIQAEAVTIFAERPLIQATSTNASRIIGSDEIANLPIRGVNAAAVLQPGIVAQDGRIYIRGGRDDEVQTYVDGASIRDIMTGSNRGTVIQEALEELQIQAGGYEAQYGNANAGIIAMAIRQGSPDYQFSVRYETDKFAESGEQFLDTYSYGYTDLTMTAAGPLPVLGEKFRFFMAGEYTFRRDDYPRFWEPFDLVHGETLNAAGDPIQLLDNGASGGVVGDPLPSSLTWGGIYGKANWDNRFTYNAVLTGDFKDIKLRVSAIGTLDQRPSNGSSVYQMFSGRVQMSDYSDMTLTARMTHMFSPKTFYELSATYFDYRQRWYDPEWQDLHPDNYWYYDDGKATFDELGYTYHSRFRDPMSYNLYGFVFQRPGRRNAGYGFEKRNYIGGKLDFTHQFKRHQLQFGGDFQLWTMRRYTGMYNQLLALYNDPGLLEADRFDAWVNNIRSNVYGYDRLGNETDDLAHWDKAKKPVIGAVYIQDRYEYKDLVINAGLRFDHFDMDQFEPVDYENPAMDNTAASLELEGFKEVEAFNLVSPRLGFGFPVTDNTVFHLQWGQFVQMPQMSQGFRSQSSIYTQLSGGYFFRDPVSFRVEPEKTTQYEIGFSQMLGTKASFDATLYYRNIQDQLTTTRIFTASDAIVTAYDITLNGDFATTKGLEFRLTLRRTSRLQGWVNYTYSDALGTGSYLGQTAASLEQGTEQVVITSPLYFNQTHKGNVSIDYRFGEGDAGPALEQLGLNLMFNFSSGHPYTLSTGSFAQNSPSDGAVLEDYDARSRRPREPIGSSITPWQFTLDARLDKTFQFGRFDVNVYVYAQNVLNSKNVVNVFPRTGSDNDGFLNNPLISGTIVAGQGADYVTLYETLNDDNRWNYFPNFRGSDLWSTPRMIRAGVMINFQ